MIPFITEVSAAAETAATTAQTTPPSSMVAQLLMLGGFILVFWLLVWRPQKKRANAHKELINSLDKGDEVVTSGGIIGRVTKVHDDYVTLQVGEQVEMSFQRVSIASMLPKGTIKNLK